MPEQGALAELGSPQYETMQSLLKARIQTSSRIALLSSAPTVTQLARHFGHSYD